MARAVIDVAPFATQKASAKERGLSRMARELVGSRILEIAAEIRELKAKGAKNLAFIGCCDLNFEKEAYLSTEAGMQAVDPALTLTYYKSGAFQFDFNNTAGATTAYNTAKAAGAGAVDAIGRIQQGCLGNFAHPGGSVQSSGQWRAHPGNQASR